METKRGKGTRNGKQFRSYDFRNAFRSSFYFQKNRVPTPDYRNAFRSSFHLRKNERVPAPFIKKEERYSLERVPKALEIIVPTMLLHLCWIVRPRFLRNSAR